MEEQADAAAPLGPTARLQRLGLPPAAAKAYVALLRLGETEARDVARVSGIPFAKVYAALDQLHAKGLANIVLDTPRRYSPRPLEEYLLLLKKAQRERLEALETESVELAALLDVQPKSVDDDRGTFIMVRGRRGSTKKVGQLIERAQADLLVLCTEGFARRAHLGAGVVEDACKRGVSVRIISQGSAEATLQLARALPAAEIRVSPSEPNAAHVAIVIADSRAALIVHFLPDDANALQGHDVGVLTTEGGIVASLAQMVGARWEAAAGVRSSSSSGPVGYRAEMG